MIFYMLGILGYYKARNKPVPAGICFAFFLVVTIPPVTTLYFLLNKHWTFQAIAFISGWFCWTFIEYFIHRFLMHRKENKQHRHSFHLIHHTNPREIFTTETRRLLITSVALLSFYGSVYFSSYLFLPAGVLTGYALYGYMHVWLHKPGMARWLGKLQEFHIQHHCGQTERCFGVTVTWWDRIFNTVPNSEKSICSKTREFYFGENESKNKLLTNH